MVSVFLPPKSSQEGDDANQFLGDPIFSDILEQGCHPFANQQSLASYCCKTEFAPIHSTLNCVLVTCSDYLFIEKKHKYE